MYKEAGQLKLRFQTNRGLLSVEQLWDLSLSELDSLAVALKKEHKESGKESFLVKKSSKDEIAKLRFDLALDVLNTKAKEVEQTTLAKENKEHNEKILALISEKQEGELKGKSVDELKAMLR